MGWSRFLRIALLGNGEGGFGKARLDGHYGFCVFGGLRFGFAGQHKHLVDMIDILLALFD